MNKNIYDSPIKNIKMERVLDTLKNKELYLTKNALDKYLEKYDVDRLAENVLNDFSDQVIINIYILIDHNEYEPGADFFNFDTNKIPKVEDNLHQVHSDFLFHRVHTKDEKKYLKFLIDEVTKPTVYVGNPNFVLNYDADLLYYIIENSELSEAFTGYVYNLFDIYERIIIASKGTIYKFF